MSLGAAVAATGSVAGVVAGGNTAAVAAVSPGTTTVVSVRSDGTGPDFPSASGRISGNGRYAVFATRSVFDDAPGETSVDAQNDSAGHNDEDVYVHDRQTGRTALVSRGVAFPPEANPVPAPANGDSTDPVISADGRYVAFSSEATNLDSSGGDRDDTSDIYLCDRDADGNGVFDDPGPFDISCIAIGRRITSTPKGSPFVVRSTGNFRPSLSADARTIAWDQLQVLPDPTDPPPYLGTVVAPTRFSEGVPATIAEGFLRDVAPLQLPGLAPFRISVEPKLSGDGRHLAVRAFYQDPATAAQTAGLLEVNLADGDGKLDVTSFNRLDVDAAGQPLFPPASDCCTPTSITADGGLVGFTSPFVDADTPIRAMVAGPGNTPGAQPVARVVSIDNDGEPGPGGDPALSADGRYVAFVTSADNMHNGVDFTGQDGPCNSSEGGFTAAKVTTEQTCADIVVRDLVLDAQRAAAGKTSLPGELASAGRGTFCQPDPLPAGAACEGDGDSFRPSLSADGRLVAFSSGADDLVPQQVRGSNMFVREFQPTVTGDPVDFGEVTVGQSATLDATVRHAGFGPVSLDGGVDLGGPDAGDFALVPDRNLCASTDPLVDADSACAVGVAFTPTAEGDRHATLTVHPRGRTPVTLDLTGRGVPVDTTTTTGDPGTTTGETTGDPGTTTGDPGTTTGDPGGGGDPGTPPDGFTATPNPLDFGQRLALSPSPPKTLTVRNVGTVPLRVERTTLPVGGGLFGGDYRIARNGCLNRTLKPGAGCQLALAYTAHGAGKRPAALQILTTQEGRDLPLAHAVTLLGSSPTPALQANPAVVVTGTVTSFGGTNFPPNATVLITVDHNGGSLRARTDAAGTLTVPYLVLAHSDLFGRKATAVVVGTTLRAEVTLLVVTGTAQPPDLATRR